MSLSLEELSGAAYEFDKTLMYLFSRHWAPPIFPVDLAATHCLRRWRISVCA